jgi:hypothetical protein
MREPTWIIYAQSGALTVEGLQRTELAQPATDPLENKKEGGPLENKKEGGPQGAHWRTSAASRDGHTSLECERSSGLNQGAK